MNNDVILHYDTLIDMDNDPVYDPEPLKNYMDKWDGQIFIDKMELSKVKSVLEIGVGTGRLGIRVAPLCREFVGIDISPKTVKRAKENLKNINNISLVCNDFLTSEITQKFDVIYTSLVFMHIKEKQKAINKIASLLNSGGKFLISIDKNQSNFIDIGKEKLKIYPDKPENIEKYIKSANLSIRKQYETEFAFIFVSKKP